MPANTNSNYKRPFPLFSAHAETIFPALFRKIKNLPAARTERITTSDDDFLDLDWRTQDSNQLVIIQHGLEGSSDRPYVLGMARIFYQHGYDVLCWSFRGCSGEMNLRPVFYHSGATSDLHEVVSHAIKKGYSDIRLVGFSLGGNLTLKYLGETQRPAEIKSAVAISAPLDLAAGADNLHTTRAKIYERRFLKTLRNKIRQKALYMPEAIDTSWLRKVKSVRDFDEYYTAPLHGYRDANDYYSQCSSKSFLKGIQVPTLILNAQNDPFLTKESLDHQLTEDLPEVHMETTRHGGHVGFMLKDTSGYYWSERRALEFCKCF
ncbi:YheT family hydrolase [Marinoscillum furvescens]|uniref:AB hydrolase-1 domain-containing protein n=1 Tax=Marinoscillum furvescens DSM 4134 TaxID=1122208 RepID=A0A3D9LIR3_MARFU|nr:alpha/beta fold hydrolase [Marinoscillum furvescens]REE05556.1 hypothetical protein C7460_10172 [Marinoscillum furvescens DSM 4134]